jgi:aminoglycoside 3-N-acetyltransferase I
LRRQLCSCRVGVNSCILCRRWAAQARKKSAISCYHVMVIATHIKKLSAGDIELARTLFAVMASVFGEGLSPVSSQYAASLLSRDDFWVIAALANGEPIAGLTAFVLPLVRSELSELFIYDIAVMPTHQRHGIGRRLVEMARSLAVERGIATTWVPVENEDVHALEFYRSVGGTPSSVTIFTFSQ